MRALARPKASTTSRRRFLQSGLALSGGLLTGCDATQPQRESTSSGPTPRRDGGTFPDASLTSECPVEFGDAAYVEDVAFVGEDDTPFEVPLSEGLDGRLFTDLRRLTPETLIIPNEAFYVRTRQPDRLDPAEPWRIRVHGLVERPLELAMETLLAAAEPLGVHLLECSGNGRGVGFGMLSSAEWSGVTVHEALSAVRTTSAGARILISGFDDHSQPSANDHSTPGASWIFSAEQLRVTGAFLATGMNGNPLPADHGAPVRLVVPGWYGCTCIKWVDRIEYVPDDAPATSQMIEFAGRTHQDGIPERARDYAPAEIDPAAMPIRVERWRSENTRRDLYRVVGIVWGGAEPVSELEIRFGDGTWQPLSVCPRPTQTSTWSLWTHWWSPETSGTFSIVLRVADPNVRTRRLDRRYYLREISV